MPDCKNCGTEGSLNYCANCGQPLILKRIDGHYLTHEIEHILHFERGILYTVKELFIRPGRTVKLYISENRSRLVKPIIFLIVTSLIYTLATHFFHIKEGYVNFQEKELTTTGRIFKWVEEHYGYANIIMGVFIALWTKLFFRKYNYNFFEILILLCFTMGMGMLIFAIFAIISGIVHFDMMQIGGYVGILYCAWAIGQFFDKTKAFNYIKALGAYLLCMVTSALFAMAIGEITDVIIKH